MRILSHGPFALLLTWLASGLCIAQPSEPRAAAADQPASLRDIQPDLDNIFRVHSSPLEVAQAYSKAGAKLTIRRGGELLALQVSLYTSDAVGFKLRQTCSSMAKREGINLAPDLQRSSVLIRAEVNKRVVGLPLFSTRNGEYQFGTFQEDHRPIPGKATTLDLLPLMARAFEELADVVPESFTRPIPPFGKAQLLPLRECVLLEAKPADEVLGFAALPLFVADVRCDPNLAHGSATTCYVVIVGRNQTEAVVNAFAKAVGAEESARLAKKRAEEARATEIEQRNREAIERERVEAAVRAVAAFRKSIKVGEETNCGPVLELKPPLVKIYSPVKDYGNEHWLRMESVFPPGYGCQFVNGKYRPPSP